MSDPVRPRPVPVPDHDDAEGEPAARVEAERPRPSPLGWPFVEGFDLSSAFPLALTRRVIRRGLRTTRRAPGERIGKVLIWIVVAAASAGLLGPRLVAADLPTDPAFVGTPARSRVIADRDYEIVDERETERRREEAGRSSRSVWDLDHARRRAEVRLLRTELAQLTGELKARAEAPPPAALEGGALPAKKELPEGLLDELAATRARLAGELERGGIAAPDDEAWVALVRATWRNRSAPEVILSAVDDALGREIVGERLLLEREENRGIIIREVGIEPPAERGVDEVLAIPDVAGRRAALGTDVAAALVEPPLSLEAEEARALADWAASLLRTTLTYNAAESELRRRKAQEDAPVALLRVRRGETILGAGEVMTERHLVLLQAMERHQGQRMQTRAALGTGAFVLLLCLIVYRFGARGVFRRRIGVKDLTLLSFVLILLELGLVGAEWAIVPLHEWLPGVPRAALFYALPVAWAAMQVRFVLSAEMAFLLALVAALVGGITTEPQMAWAAAALLSSMAGTAGVQHIRTRWQLVLAGAAAGVVAAGTAVTIELFRGTLMGLELVWLSSAALLGGVMSGLLVAGLTPLVEATFGYVTDLRLLSLADLNQPLLRELIVRAPGTWHHSMRTARLAETAATAIEANTLMVRVMSLYHDVGKIREPQYFSENITGDNPHDRLDPEQSAAHIKGHVEHGRELAARHRLPKAVAAVIDEHHGDNLIEYFYRRALSSSDERAAAALDEAPFRYGGRYPRSRESALVMLADQMEAAVRGLDDPAPELIRQVVDHFLNRAVVDGSLADCDLSLRDIEVCREAFRFGLEDLIGRGAGETDTEIPALRSARAGSKP